MSAILNVGSSEILEQVLLWLLCECLWYLQRVLYRLCSLSAFLCVTQQVCKKDGNLRREGKRLKRKVDKGLALTFSCSGADIWWDTRNSFRQTPKILPWVQKVLFGEDNWKSDRAFCYLWSGYSGSISRKITCWTLRVEVDLQECFLIFFIPIIMNLDVADFSRGYFGGEC